MTENKEEDVKGEGERTLPRGDLLSTAKARERERTSSFVLDTGLRRGQSIILQRGTSK